jgi:uroporphyrinogen-III decarboxylase
MIPSATDTKTMTTRERITAVLEGEEVDRFPVWLKMLSAGWRTPQPEPYKSMGNIELLRAVGCDPMVGLGLPVKGSASHVTRNVTEQSGVRVTVVTTPDGELRGEEKYDPGSSSWHPTVFMAETPENLKKLQWMFRDTEYTVAPDAVENARRRKKELEKEDAFTMSGIGPSPYMYLLQHLSGPISTVYLMADEPELFRETLEVMRGDRMRNLRAVLPGNPTDTFWLTENTSTTLLSPDIFREFCMPYLKDCGELIREHGIYPVHHMCGTLNALLEMIDELPAAANEAYTTRPLGDVSLAEGRTRMPSKALIGGTNATGWLAPAERIVETVADDIAACPDRRKIFLTSAGVLPPLVSFEKAKTVVEEFKRL